MAGAEITVAADWLGCLFPLVVAALPHLNAAINTVVAVLLVLGLLLIKGGRRRAHQFVMTLALALSSLFLCSYLTYHAVHGPTSFRGQGAIRTAYFVLLGSHTILAALSVPMILLTTFRAYRAQFERHRRLAKITWPLWFYVAVTGPLVYLVLYHLDLP